MKQRNIPKDAIPEIGWKPVAAIVLAVGSLAVYTVDELQPIQDGINGIGIGLLEGVAAVGESG